MANERSPERDGRTKDPTPADAYLTEVEVAKLLKISQRTLQRWRQEGSQGLPFRRFGGLVRYSRADIEGWSKAQARASTSETCHAPE
jgi:excisionase family DNA binding protein